MFIGGTVIPASAYQESPVWIPGGSPPFVPTDIAGCYLWFQADGISGADGDPISSWPDQSGGSRDATGSGSDRPTLKTAILNGHNIARFNGSNRLITSSFGGLTSQPMTIFFVGSVTTPSDSQFALDSLDASPRVALLIFANAWSIFAGNLTSAGTPSAGFHYIGTIVNGASTTLTIDSGAPATVDAGTSGLNGIVIGAANNFALPWIGDMAEIIFYNSALGSTDYATVKSYLAAKYAI